MRARRCAVVRRVGVTVGRRRGEEKAASGAVGDTTRISVLAERKASHVDNLEAVYPSACEHPDPPDSPPSAQANTSPTDGASFVGLDRPDPSSGQWPASRWRMRPVWEVEMLEGKISCLRALTDRLNAAGMRGHAGPEPGRWVGARPGSTADLRRSCRRTGTDPPPTTTRPPALASAPAPPRIHLRPARYGR